MKNSEFQIFRWGIPGWIFLLTILFLMTSLDEFNIINIIDSFDNNSILTGITALFISLGIPIGYVLYQIYFLFKWRIKPFFVREIKFLRKRKRGIYLAIKDIKDFEYEITYKANEDWLNIENYYYKLLTTNVPKKKISIEVLQIRIEQLSSRTSRIHGLGASVWGLSLGLITFLFVSCPDIDFDRYINSSLIVIVLIIFFTVLNYFAQNENSFVQLNSLMKDILEAEDVNG